MITGIVERARRRRQKSTPDRQQHAVEKDEIDALGRGGLPQRRCPRTGDLQAVLGQRGRYEAANFTVVVNDQMRGAGMTCSALNMAPIYAFWACAARTTNRHKMALGDKPLKMHHPIVTLRGALFDDALFGIAHAPFEFAVSETGARHRDHGHRDFRILQRALSACPTRVHGGARKSAYAQTPHQRSLKPCRSNAL